jgi:hypothetical protein
MNGLIMYLSNDGEHVAVSKGTLNPYNRMGDCIDHFAQNIFAAGCRSDNKDHFTHLGPFHTAIRAWFQNAILDSWIAGTSAAELLFR